MIQDPERVYEELERLRRIEAAARAWLDIDTVFDSDHTVELETVEAREALRKAIGESDELRKAPQL